MTVAALYVDPHGVYANLPGVEVWDEARDARTYAGPWPVVAHPPCNKWSPLAYINRRRIPGYEIGDDGGCFAAALDAVRRFGGVLEHPAHSAAWDAFGLPEPLVVAGWTGGTCGGWSAYVEQDRYGHVTRKPTWLYAFGVELPDLRWGRRDATEDDARWYVGDKPKYARPMGSTRLRGGSARSSATPTAFRDALLGIAASGASRPAC